jgi:solute carrier family 25 (mitochondrial carnitine/acylcarnitine transporter), member 20/29
MDRFLEGLVPAVCGFAYGITSVVVGQPLETVKTQMQTLQKQSAVDTARKLVQEEGIRGLYRGGIPLVLGGGLIRSAQFGAYENVLRVLKTSDLTRHLDDGPKKLIDPLVVIAGVCGGISRGVVEGPFEFIKVRQQVVKSWSFREVFHGYGATMFRNAGLFGFFCLCKR